MLKVAVNFAILLYDSFNAQRLLQSFVIEYIRVSSAPTASHDSVSPGRIRIMWQRYPDSTASFISGYRVVCSYSEDFSSDYIIDCDSTTILENQSSVTLTDLDPSTPLFVRVQVVRTINEEEAVDELSSPTSDLICPGKYMKPIQMVLTQLIISCSQSACITL